MLAAQQALAAVGAWWKAEAPRLKRWPLEAHYDE